MDVRIENYDDLVDAWKEKGYPEEKLPSEDQLCETLLNMDEGEGSDCYVFIMVEKGGEDTMVRIRFSLYCEGSDLREFRFCGLYEDGGEREEIKILLACYDFYAAECEKRGVRILSEDSLEEFCRQEIRTFTNNGVEMGEYFVLNMSVGDLFFDCFHREDDIYEVGFCDEGIVNGLIELLGYDRMVAEWMAQGLPKEMLLSKDGMKQRLFNHVFSSHCLDDQPVDGGYFEDEEGIGHHVRIFVRINDFDDYEEIYYFEYAGLEVTPEYAGLKVIPDIEADDKPKKQHWWQKLRRK